VVRGGRPISGPQAALLASVLPAPGHFDPQRDPEGARARRDRVLGRMRATGALDEAALAAATAAPLGLDPHAFPDVAPHAWSRAGAGRTCVMPTLQTAVEAIAARAEGVDGIGIVALDVATGGVQVLVGGRAPDARTLDATSRPRSAGSTLKPFLWALAYDEGLAAPGTRLLALPWTSPEWAPEDFDRTPAGPWRQRRRCRRPSTSRQCAWRQGCPGRFPAALRGLGFAHVRVASAGPAIDLALGTDAVTALELAAAYAALVRGDAPGLSRGACGLALEALSDPARARTAGAPAQGVAWKTGTSSRRRDAWAVGVTRRVVAVVWRGRLDGGSDPRLVGVEAAVPTLFEVIGVLDPDPLPFDAPCDVTRVTVCAETGLAAGPACGATRVDRRPAGARAAPYGVPPAHRMDAATGALLCARCRAERSVRTIDIALQAVLGAWRERQACPWRISAARCGVHGARRAGRARPAFAAPRAGARAVAGREGTASIAVRVLAPDPATWLTLVVDAEPPRRVPSGVGVEVTLSAGRHVLTALSASGRAATTEVEVVAGR
jgi:membrane carboxypeptidase/penicillin-binding protein PbpC